MERGHLGLSFQPGNGLLIKLLRSTRGPNSISRQPTCLTSLKEDNQCVIIIRHQVFSPDSCFKTFVHYLGFYNFKSLSAGQNGPQKKGGKRKRENKAADCLANQDASISSMAAFVMAGTSILPLRQRISWVPCSRYLSP